MRPGLALIVAGVAAWMPPAALTAAGPTTTITVRVYQSAGLTPALEQRALEGAAAALRPALVEVRWRICTGPNRSTACDRRPDPSELSLRIVPEGSPGWNASITLGTAYVAPRVGGVLATVYFGHVERLARETHTDVAVLLGRAAAHELGHLLMRTSAHPSCGLMRANWTQKELQRNRPPDWAFTGGDVVAMRHLSPGH